MVPSVEEIVLLVITFVCVIGLGWLGRISEAYGERRARRWKAKSGQDGQNPSDS